MSDQPDQLDIRQRLARLSIEERAELERRLMESATRDRPRPGIPRRGPGTTWPVSFGQERLWVLHQFDPAQVVFNVSRAMRLEGPLDVGALARAFDALIERHEVLRTTFTAIEGEPHQLIGPPRPMGLREVDLRGASPDERAVEVERHLREEARRPFDLATDLMLRGRLLRLGPAEHVLAFSTHHIASDGWSGQILSRELGALYRAFAAGEASPLPPLPIQYADYAVWHRRWFEGVREAQLAYWRQRLDGAPPTLQLPTDRPRPPVQSHRGARVSAVLPAPLIDSARALARAQRATLFMALLAAFKVLLARHTGHPDVVVGTPAAGRIRAETEGLIGFFVNTLVLRTDLSGDPSVRAAIDRIRETALGAYGHQEAPFERLVQALRPERLLDRGPLVQVSFGLLDGRRGGATDFPDLTVTPLQIDAGAAQYDLAVSAAPVAGGLDLRLEYSTDLFDEGTMTRLLEHYRVLLEGMVATPDSRLSRVPCLAPDERRRVVSDWNSRPRSAGAAAMSLHGLVEAQAARTPERVAVVQEERALTYRQLDDRANRLARQLGALGVRPGARVGLCADRSIEMAVGLLAILKAGGAFVPLDAAVPRRLASMIEDAGIEIVLADPSEASRIPAVGTVRTVVIAEDDAGIPSDAPAVPCRHDAAAYVLYTSGSTGQPKGVVVEHRQLLAYACAVVEQYGMADGGGFAMLQPLTVDSCQTVIFPALGWGGTVHLIDRDRALDPAALAAYFRQHRVDVLKIAPTHLAALISEAATPADLLPARCLILGGEASHWDFVDRLSGGSPSCQIWNHYGPTETTVGVLTYRVDTAPRAHREATAAVPLGRPLGHAEVYVLDPYGSPQPIGVPGEICVGGAAVSCGYLGQPALTAARYLPDPFSGAAGGRLYRTGDRGRFLADGTVEFLGRADDQVKVRGFRVELGEIESVLGDHPAVAERIVLARASAPSTTTLVAYVVPREGQKLEPAAVREFLGARLPEPMVPAAIVVLDSLPRSAQGKVARSALPVPDEGSWTAEEPYVPPATAVEEMIAAIWAPILGVPRVGAEGHFFRLGGHSLLAVRAVAQMGKALGVDVPLRRLFEMPTVRGLAEHIAGLQGPGSRAAPARIPRAPRDGPLPLSFAQERFWFLHQLRPTSSIYNSQRAFRLTGELEESSFRRAIEAIVARHEPFRTAFVATADGLPVQVVCSEVSAPVRCVDLSGEPSTERLARARQIVAEDQRLPFDLTAAPLVRVTVLRLDPLELIVVVTIHHIIGDAWSTAVFFKELAETYAALRAGVSPRLEPLGIQYGDYARWQRERLTSGALDSQLAYWRRQLGGRLPITELPSDRPRPPQQSFQGRRSTRALSKDLSRRLAELRGREDVSLFMTLLAALQALLGRHSGEDDVIVGAPFAGRDRLELENMLGCFLNLLPLRTDLSGDPTFHELLARVRNVVLDAYANQDVPFEQLLREFRPTRDPGRTPLFQVLLNMHEFEDRISLPGATLAERLPSARTRSLFDVTLYFKETSEAIELSAVYSTDLFDDDRIDELLAQLEQFLEQAASNPDGRLSEVSLVTSAARRVLPDLAEVLDEDWPGPVHGGFRRQARRAPEALAVVDAHGEWTYGELSARSTQLARYLRDRGIGREDVVAILAHRSAPLVCALLGVLEAGAAFMILDPSYPDARLLQYLETARPRGWIELVPAAPSVAAAVAGVAARCRIGPRLELIMPTGDLVGALPAPDVDAEVGPATLACVTFTSGSTGQPKGVLGCHGSLAQFLPWQAEAWGFSPADRFSMLSGLSHDPLQRDVFTPLWVGATICIPDPDRLMAPGWIGEWMARQRVTVANLTPATIELIAIGPGGAPELPALRSTFTVGDSLTRRHVEQLRRLAPEATHVNYYGATETQRALGYFVVPKDPGALGKDTVPLGQGVPGVQLLVARDGGAPCGIGELGEIQVRSVHLARGYLDDAALTREKFVDNPRTRRPGDRVYRTGDLGRYRADGAVEFVGRRAGLTKIRGFRVEIAEIEAALAALPGVRQVVVVARPSAVDGAELVAYVVAAAPPDVDPRALQLALERRLPRYMIPSFIVPLDALPITPNGKIDRDALPDPERRGSTPGRSFVPPADPLHDQIAQIWEDLLDVRPVGIFDDFFALGGHSLLAVRMLSEVERVCGRAVPLRSLLPGATIRRIADVLRANEAPSFSSPVALIQRGSRPPFFFLHGDFNGGGFYCVKLARLLGSEHSFYAVHPDGLDGGPIGESIEEMAERRLGPLRAIQPHGPYVLGGHCNGGLVALEMARRLQAEGESVPLVVIVDSVAGTRWSRFQRRVRSWLTATPARARFWDHYGYYRGRAREFWEAGHRSRIELLRRRWRRRRSRRAQAEDAFASRHGGSVDLPEWQSRIAAYRAVITRYTPRRYRGRVAVLVPEAGRRRRRPDLGWGGVADEVEVHVVPGAHLTILTRHVESLASRLRACLDTVHPR